MAILKVDVAKPVTLAIANIEEVEGQFGPQLKFEATNGDVLFVGKETGERQLDRIGMSGGNAIGHTLLFEKVAKNGKTYLNINPAPSGARGTGGASNGAAATTQPAATTQARPATRHEIAQALDVEIPAAPGAELYTECLRAAKQAVTTVLGAVPPEAIIAAAATLYIQASKR